MALAQGYVIQSDTEKALDALEQYTNICMELVFPLKLYSDEFFDQIDNWLEAELDIGTNALRNEKTIKISIFGIMLISVVLTGSVLFKNSYGSLLFTGSFITILFLIKLSSKIERYNPLKLANQNMDLLNESIQPSKLTSPLITCLIVIALSIISSILIFDKKQI